MANVKVFPKKVKGHGQGHKFKIYGTVGKVLSRITHAKYERLISKSKEVMANVKVFWRTDRQADGQSDY